MKKDTDGLFLLNSSSVSPVLSDITGDSRESAPCSVFCCIRGEKKDGHEFAPSAVERGAAVLLAEREVSLNVPQIISQEVRRDMGRLASIIYGEPSSKMLMFAVTGTNGKSTTTWMIRHILQSAGIRTGLFGTIVYNDGAEERDAGRTTRKAARSKNPFQEWWKMDAVPVSWRHRPTVFLSEDWKAVLLTVRFLQISAKSTSIITRLWRLISQPK